MAAAGSHHSLEQLASFKYRQFQAEEAVADAKSQPLDTEKAMRRLAAREVSLRKQNFIWNGIKEGWSHWRMEEQWHKIRDKERLVAELGQDTDVLDAVKVSGRPVEEVVAFKKRLLLARNRVRLLEEQLATMQAQQKKTKAIKETEGKLRKAQEQLDSSERSWDRLQGISPARRALQDQSVHHRQAQRTVQRIDKKVREARTMLEQAQTQLRNIEARLKQCMADIECRERNLEAYERELRSARSELQDAEQAIVRATEDPTKTTPAAESLDTPSSATSSAQQDEDNPDAGNDARSYNAVNAGQAVQQLSNRMQDIGRHVWNSGETIVNEAGRNLHRGWATYFARPKGLGRSRIHRRM